MRRPTTWEDWNTGAQPVFILSITWAGIVYRFSTYPIAVAYAAEGITYNYHGGLEDPAFAEAAEAGQVSTGGASVPLSVTFPGAINVAEEIGKKHPLGAATGELAMILVDPKGAPITDYGDRYVLVRGRIVQPVYGFLDDLSRADFSLESIAPDDTRTLISEMAQINATTWPTASDAVSGRIYPTIIGRPGSYTYNNADNPNVPVNVQGSPAYKVRDDGIYDLVLIAGHHVQADQVLVWDSAGTTATCTVQNSLDGIGQLVAIVNIYGSALSSAGDEFYVSWSTGGGMINPFGSGAEPLRAAGDVMCWAMSGTEGVDLDKWMAERGALNRIAIDTYLNDPKIRPYEWIRNSLLGLLSIAIREGPRGIFPRVRIAARDASDCVAIITEGPDFMPLGPVTVQTEISDIRNKITLRYAPSAQNQSDFRRSVTISADPGDSVINDSESHAADSDQYSSAYTVISQSRYGVRSETIDTRVICDDASAGLILSERIINRGFAERTREYEGGPWFGFLNVGDWIALTSDTLNTTQLPVEIVAKTWTGFAWAFSIMFKDDPMVQS